MLTPLPYQDDVKPTPALGKWTSQKTSNLQLIGGATPTLWVRRTFLR